MMIEFHKNNIPSASNIKLDLNMDGVTDYLVHTSTPDAPEGLQVLLFSLADGVDLGNLPVSANSGPDGTGTGAYNQVLELKIPLSYFNTKAFIVNDIESMVWDNNKYIHGVDKLGGLSAEINIKEFADSANSSDTKVSSTLISFPCNESLWKTTNGGKTWERILTSGLNVSIDSKQLKVGNLASVVLSVDFVQDNTLFVYESSGKVWVSTNGGITFAPYK